VEDGPSDVREDKDEAGKDAEARARLNNSGSKNAFGEAFKKILQDGSDQGDSDKFFKEKVGKDHHEAALSKNFAEEAMYIDHYSGTFYSLINKYKKKYHLLTEDQAQYYFEALFLLFIQTVFCIAILTSPEMDFQNIITYQTNYALHLCLFFTSMILHFGSIYTIRNGITMCKYVIYHSEEFDHP